LKKPALSKHHHDDQRGVHWLKALQMTAKCCRALHKEFFNGSVPITAGEEDTVGDGINQSGTAMDKSSLNSLFRDGFLCYGKRGIGRKWKGRDK
jgi:hypothetical protein